MRDRRSGFTLIELLVVIAIIAILAAILLPIFAQARLRAFTSRCLGNLKQLATAISMYVHDNDGRMPQVGREASNGSGNWAGCEEPDNQYSWVYPERGQIWKYTRNRGIYLCPVDAGRPAGDELWDQGKKMYPLSYSMNSYLDKAKPDSLNIYNPSKFMMLIHEYRGKVNDAIYVPRPGDTRDIPDNVHYDGTTLVYLDGRARWASQKTLVKERDEGNWWPKGTY